MNSVLLSYTAKDQHLCPGCNSTAFISWIRCVYVGKDIANPR